jgi:septum formation protein
MLCRCRFDAEEPMKLVLASTSPWRLRMLLDAGIDVVAMPSGVDERRVTETDPVRLAQILAEHKARAVLDRAGDALVLGADQVLTIDGQALGKPPDPDTHLKMLQRLRGRSHRLITGFALIGPGVCHVGHEETTLWVRADLTDRELATYVNSGEGSACAGGYAIEGHGAMLFSRIEGDYFNILGLPLFRVWEVLRQVGWRYGAAP